MCLPSGIEYLTGKTLPSIMEVDETDDNFSDGRDIPPGTPSADGVTVPLSPDSSDTEMAESEAPFTEVKSKRKLQQQKREIDKKIQDRSLTMSFWNYVNNR